MLTLLMNRYSDINEITRMTGNDLGIFDNIIWDGEKVSSVTGFTDIIEKVDKCKTSGVICSPSNEGYPMVGNHGEGSY